MRGGPRPAIGYARPALRFLGLPLPLLLATAPLVTSALTTSLARADEPAPPKSVTHEYSPYEKESIRLGLAETGLTLEPSPEGKRIEGYDVVTLDVFEERDPIPTFLNVFHWTSRPYTVSRELLAKPGDVYRKVTMDETARNLRKLSGQISLVLVVPVKGKQPGSVRVLLITKDVWSLRLNSNVRYAGGLDYLYLQPSEQNVFGTHHVAAIDFGLYPLSYSLGGMYKVPWVLGSRTAATANLGMVVNRQSDRAEGSYGTLIVSRPLFSTRTEWGWEARGQWNVDVGRRYSNARLATFDAKDTPEKDGIPWQYRRTTALARAQAIRSFGWAFKNDFTVGLEAKHLRYHTFDTEAFNPVGVAEFERRVLPRSDTRVGPFVQWQTYKNDYLRVLDVEILGLQEDYRLGHDVIARVYPVAKAFGATRDFVGGLLRTQWTQALGDGLARASIEGVVEAPIADLSRPTDTSVESRLRLVTPRTGIGRLVFDGGFVRRFNNYLNLNESLGGETRPRGWPTRFLFGPNAAAYSLEFRTRPLEILKTQWGLVAFTDAGDAYAKGAEFKLHHSIGGGVRALFPQFDRVAFRLDVGFPIARGGLPPGVSPMAVVFTVDQAFSFPSIRDATTLE